MSLSLSVGEGGALEQREHRDGRRKNRAALAVDAAEAGSGKGGASPSLSPLPRKFTKETPTLVGLGRSQKVEKGYGDAFKVS